MTVKTKISALSVAAILFFSNAAISEAQITKRQKTQKTRTELIDENGNLVQTIDSLKAEIERYRTELKQIKDSIASEATEVESAEIYEEDVTSLNPEDYTPEITDSLLNIWYLQKKMNHEDFTPEYDMSTVKFESNVPDEVYIERIKEMNSFIDLPYNSIVRNYIIQYSEKMSARMPGVLGLCSYYMPIFEEIFIQYDMPQELKALAVIESTLNPTAVSRAGAKGMWQFMYSTAKFYGLTIDSFVDERFDPVKSAHAVAAYLKDAYDIFGDWNLAIASYNCGIGNVNKAIRRSGGKRAFWDIYPYLPRETRGYVPAFVGALYTMTYYKEHGIVPKAIELPAVTDTFKIHKMLHFQQVSDLTGVPLQTLEDLNPQYRHDIIPGNEKEYILRIPYQYSNAFIDHEDSLYTYKADKFFNPVVIRKIKDGGDGERIIHKVKSGEVLGLIALKYRCSVSQIKRWNNLKSDNIRVGQRLVVYRGGHAAPASSSKTSSGSKTTASSSQKIPENTSYTIYTVKYGDSLYTIAKDYPGVSAQNIMDFNGIGSNIKPGMKLRIPNL